jgi:hypothetical protein
MQHADVSLPELGTSMVIVLTSSVPLVLISVYTFLTKRLEIATFFDSFYDQKILERDFCWFVGRSNFVS